MVRKYAQRRELRFVIIILSMIVLDSCDLTSQFDPAEWKTNASARYKMTEDIVDNRRLVGKTKNEIIQILGTDYEKGPCDNCLGYQTNNPNIGFSIDHEVLAILFDKSNSVVEVRIDMW